MKILVTGGAGYIGSHLVHDLVEQKHKVTVYDNLTTGYDTNLPAKAKLVTGDLQDKKKLSRVFKKGFDAVIHFAGLKRAGESMEKPEIYSENNLTGTINLLNAMVASGTKHIVFSSSSSVYGDPVYTPIDEKHPLQPMSYYGFTKLEIERIIEWYSKLKGIRYAALRYFNAAGYDEKGRVKGRERFTTNLIPLVMEVANGTRPGFTVFGTDYLTPDGTCVRDYIHVNDLADAHIRAMHYIMENGNIAVNLGVGKGYSILEVINKAEEVTGRKIKYDLGPRREGDPAVTLASNQLAFELLGWKAVHSELDNILRTSWEVYKD